MKNWIIVSMFIALLAVGCSSAPKMPGEVSLAPGPDQVKAPWAGFNEGAWVQYQVVNPMTNTISEYRQSIHQIARGRAVIVTAVKVGDKWEMGPANPVDLFPIAKPASKASATETVKVGNKEISCKVADMTYKMNENSTTMKAWMCEEIPGGLAKREMGGQVVWQAVDFGLTSKTPTLAEVTEPKNAWANFGKGSWVRYKILNPADEKEIQQKYTIIEIGKEKIKVEISELVGDKWETKNTPEVSLQPVLVPKNQGAPATLDVAGKKVNCTCLEKTSQMGNMATIVKEWISDDVPGGLVRKEMAGKCVVEVVDFGVSK